MPHSTHLEEKLQQFLAVSIRTKLEGSNDRGIIAIAVDKMLDLDLGVREFTSHSSASTFAETIAKALFAKVVHYQSEWVDPRVVGFFGVIQFLAKTEFPQSVGPSYYLALLILASPQYRQETDFNRLRRMIAKINSSFSGGLYAGAET
jgi:hypothetical protein